MKYQKIIPVITFIIGGGIGFECGAKYVLHIQKQYVKSDEYKKYMEKQFKDMFEKRCTEIMKES